MNQPASDASAPTEVSSGSRENAGDVGALSKPQGASAKLVMPLTTGGVAFAFEPLIVLVTKPRIVSELFSLACKSLSTFAGGSLPM